MAIERNSNDNGFTGANNGAPLKGFGKTAEEAFNQKVEQKQSTIDQGTTSVLRSIFSQNTSGPISRQSGTVRLNEIMTRASKALKDAESSEVTLTAHKLDNQVHNVFVPAILIAGRNKTNPDVAYVYTLILEREDVIDPEIRTIDGGFKAVIPVVTGTAWDKRYSDVVKTIIGTAFNMTHENIKILPAAVLAKDVDVVVPTDQFALTAGLSDALFNACFAINTRMQEDKGLTRFVLAKTAENEIMTVEPRFSRSLVKDKVGREKRADIELTFGLKEHSQKSTSLNGGSHNQRKFGTVTGYIDFIPVMVEGQVRTGWGTQVQAMQKFSPLFVVTSMFTEEAGTLHAHLAMLMSIATLANNDEWVYSMYERHQESKRSGEKIDIGEIGALNMEVNLPQYRPQDAQGINTSFGPIVDTRVADLDKAKYIQLVQQLCNQEMFIAIDAPNVGAESWYTDVFRASAVNDELGRSMADRIFRALQDLTQDRFAAAFQSITKNTKLWLTDPINIHNGYYVKHTNKGSERRDIRDVDTLTIANILGPNDPTACARWGATFMPGVTAARALTERKEMLEAVCGGPNNIAYTGYSTRLMLNPAVIKALLMCAADVSFNMRFVSTYSQGVGGFGNHGFNFGGAAGLSSSNVSSTFRGGFNDGTNGNVLNANNSFFGTGGSSGLSI